MNETYTQQIIISILHEYLGKYVADCRTCENSLDGRPDYDHNDWCLECRPKEHNWKLSNNTAELIAKDILAEMYNNKKLLELATLDYTQIYQKYSENKTNEAFESLYDSNKQIFKSVLEFYFPKAEVIIDMDMIQINYPPFTKVTDNIISQARYISTNTATHSTTTGTTIEILLGEKQ